MKMTLAKRLIQPLRQNTFGENFGMLFVEAGLLLWLVGSILDLSIFPLNFTLPPAGVFTMGAFWWFRIGLILMAVGGSGWLVYYLTKRKPKTVL